MASYFENSDNKFLIKDENDEIKIVCNTLGSKTLSRKKFIIKKGKKYIFELEIFKRFKARTQILLVDDKNNTLKEFELKMRTTNISTILHTNEDINLVLKLNFIRGRIGDFLLIKNLILKELDPLYINNTNTTVLSLDKLLISSKNNQNRTVYTNNKTIARRSNLKSNPTKAVVARRSNLKSNPTKATLVRKGIEDRQRNNRAIIKFNINEYIDKNEIDKTYIDKNPYLEILFPIADRVSFLRTIFLPDKYKNIYYLIPEECKSYIINNLIHSKLMDKIFFIRGWSDILNVIEELQPKRIYLTVFPYIKIVEKLKKYIHKITFVHHGIIVDKKAISKIEKGWNRNIKYMVPNIDGQKILRSSRMENVELINGLPQFDYSIKNLENKDVLRESFCKKHKISEDTKIVLLIHGSSPGKYYSNRDFLKKVRTAIGTVRKSIKIHLIIKFKYKYRNISDDKTTTILSNKDLIYDYYFADAIIVVEGGTALVETLITVPEKTLVIDWMTNVNDIYQVNKLNIIKATDPINLQKKLSELLLLGSYESNYKIKN